MDVARGGGICLKQAAEKDAEKKDMVEENGLRTANAGPGRRQGRLRLKLDQGQQKLDKGKWKRGKGWWKLTRTGENQTSDRLLEENLTE